MSHPFGCARALPRPSWAARSQAVSQVGRHGAGVKRNEHHPATCTPTGLWLQRKCACGGKVGSSGACADCQRRKTLGWQTQLAVGAADDVYEREAERVAQQVAGGPALQQAGMPRIQRLSAAPRRRRSPRQ
jgi:hypothetical protein